MMIRFWTNNGNDDHRKLWQTSGDNCFDGDDNEKRIYKSRMTLRMTMTMRKLFVSLA